MTSAFAQHREVHSAESTRQRSSDEAETTADAATAAHEPDVRDGEVLMDRCIDVLGGDRPGPTTLIFVGIHGNEPSSVDAVQHAFESIRARGVAVNGKVVAMVGNPTALARHERHIDVDLNRAFTYRLTHDGVRFTPSASPGDAEYDEMRGLLDAIRCEVDARDRSYPFYAVDLHTFSADGAPFVIYSDTLRNRTYAEHLPVPEILGLAELMPGTLTDYLTAAGCISIVFESGRHDDAQSVVNHESAIRLLLVGSGHMAVADMPELGDDRRRLVHASRTRQPIPEVLDVQVRHGLPPNHTFRMKDGFNNFTAVTAGQLLAEDRGEQVRAERSGRILLPLYQQKGTDGYFIARPIGRGWLRVSRILRGLHVHRLMHWLPGVSPHADIPEGLLVDRKIARYLARDVFHLFGYRMAMQTEDTFVFIRRPFDTRDPDEIVIAESE